MPKYYIRDGEETAIMEADNPVVACAKALYLFRFSTIMAGGHYWVSEQGFGARPDAQKIDSDEVNEEYVKIFPSTG